ncbi:hypothetical protein BDZ88DRAFT_82258 [Geranomyces variabilis]|nr:hypothetical protein BDZ88DRAFT_82258 [Geranomyces variabilis]
MGDAGFFKDQRFGDKQKKLLKSMKFPKLFDKKVDVKKVNMTVIRPWVTARVVEMVGFEDDVLIEFVFNLLEADKVDPRAMQIEISGFLEGNAPSFMKDLWGLLVSAQSTIGGIPQQFLDQKKAEIIKKRVKNECFRSLLSVCLISSILGKIKFRQRMRRSGPDLRRNMPRRQQSGPSAKLHVRKTCPPARQQKRGVVAKVGVIAGLDLAAHLAALTAPPEDMPIPGTVMTEGAEAAMSALFMIEIGARIGGTMTAAATSIIMPLQGAGHETPESVIARRNRIVTEIGLAMNGVGQIEHERRQVRRVIQVIVAYAGGDPKAGAETRLQAVGVGLIRPGRQAQAAHTRATRDPTQDHQCRTLTRARTLIRAQIRADPGPHRRVDPKPAMLSAGERRSCLPLTRGHSQLPVLLRRRITPRDDGASGPGTVSCAAAFTAAIRASIYTSFCKLDV